MRRYIWYLRPALAYKMASTPWRKVRELRRSPRQCPGCGMPFLKETRGNDYARLLAYVSDRSDAFPNCVRRPLRLPRGPQKSLAAEMAVRRASVELPRRGHCTHGTLEQCFCAWRGAPELTGSTAQCSVASGAERVAESRPFSFSGPALSRNQARSRQRPLTSTSLPHESPPSPFAVSTLSPFVPSSRRWSLLWRSISPTVSSRPTSSAPSRTSTYLQTEEQASLQRLHASSVRRGYGQPSREGSRSGWCPVPRGALDSGGRAAFSRARDSFSTGLSSGAAACVAPPALTCASPTGRFHGFSCACSRLPRTQTLSSAFSPCRSPVGSPPASNAPSLSPPSPYSSRGHLCWWRECGEGCSAGSTATSSPEFSLSAYASFSSRRSSPSSFSSNLSALEFSSSCCRSSLDALSSAISLPFRPTPARLLVLRMSFFSAVWASWLLGTVAIRHSSTSRGAQGLQTSALPPVRQGISQAPQQQVPTEEARGEEEAEDAEEETPQREPGTAKRQERQVQDAEEEDWLGLAWRSLRHSEVLDDTASERISREMARRLRHITATFSTALQSAGRDGKREEGSGQISPAFQVKQKHRQHRLAEPHTLALSAAFRAVYASP